MKLFIALLAALITATAVAQRPADLNQDPSFLVRVNWNAPTTNTDSTPLTNLAGYIIYYHTTQKPASCTTALACATWASNVSFLRVTNAGLTTVDITTQNGLRADTMYYFYATAFNSASIESTYSNEASQRTPSLLIPGAPTVVTVNITFPTTP